MLQLAIRLGPMGAQSERRAESSGRSNLGRRVVSIRIPGMTLTDQRMRSEWLDGHLVPDLLSQKQQIWRCSRPPGGSSAHCFVDGSCAGREAISRAARHAKRACGIRRSPPAVRVEIESVTGGAGRAEAGPRQRHMSGDVRRCVAGREPWTGRIVSMDRAPQSHRVHDRHRAAVPEPRTGRVVSMDRAPQSHRVHGPPPRFALPGGNRGRAGSCRWMARRRSRRVPDRHRGLPCGAGTVDRPDRVDGSRAAVTSCSRPPPPCLAGREPWTGRFVSMSRTPERRRVRDGIRGCLVAGKDGGRRAVGQQGRVTPCSGQRPQRPAGTLFLRPYDGQLT
jgi:hypothetical protein